MDETLFPCTPRKVQKRACIFIVYNLYFAKYYQNVQIYEFKMKIKMRYKVWLVGKMGIKIFKFIMNELFLMH